MESGGSGQNLLRAWEGLNEKEGRDVYARVWLICVLESHFCVDVSPTQTLSLAASAVRGGSILWHQKMKIINVKIV